MLVVWPLAERIQAHVDLVIEAKVVGIFLGFGGEMDAVGGNAFGCGKVIECEHW